MKKIVSMVLACAMALSAAMVSFAESSPVVAGVTTKIEAATEAGTAVELKVEEVAKEVVESLPEVAEKKAVACFDLSIAGEVTGKVTVTFTIPGLKAGAAVAVKNYVGSEWVDVPAEVKEDTKLVAVFEHFSPVAIYVDGAVADDIGDISLGAGNDQADETLAPATEAPATEAPATEAPAEVTTVATQAAPNATTGNAPVALAVIPVALCAAAVVISKRK